VAERHHRVAVVINDEDQYSIWDADRRPPPGWRSAGFAGTKAECLAYIDEVWTDPRPRSVRAAGGARGATAPDRTSTGNLGNPGDPNLTTRGSEGRA
jgi:MbtH protein